MLLDLGSLHETVMVSQYSLNEPDENDDAQVLPRNSNNLTERV